MKKSLSMILNMVLISVLIIPANLYANQSEGQMNSDDSSNAASHEATGETDLRTIRVISDPQPLVLRLTGKPNETVTEAENTLTGQYNQDVAVSIKLNGTVVNERISKDANESFSQVLVFRKGRNAVEFVALDKSGNETTRKFAFIYLPYADAVVDSDFDESSAEMDGQGAIYKSIQAAIDNVPLDNSEAYIILLKKGTYREVVTVDRPFVSLIGENTAETIITYDNASGTPKPDGSTYGTSGSATVLIKASDFTAENITFQNSFDEEAFTYSNKQAVAVKTQADRLIFRNCRFIGNQATLYANYGRQYFLKSYIEGDVDIIFGGAQAVFEDSEVFSVSLGSATTKGYITAASTMKTDFSGFLFMNCRLTSNAPTGTVFLGRPWQPGGNTNAIASVLFKNCDLGDHINSNGWDNRGLSLAANARFYEFGSTGPGANVSPTRKVLNDREAENFSLNSVFMDWDPNAYLKTLYTSTN